jgi:hypothetical protein
MLNKDFQLNKYSCNFNCSTVFVTNYSGSIYIFGRKLYVYIYPLRVILAVLTPPSTAHHRQLLFKFYRNYTVLY